MQLRPATEADLPALAELQRAYDLAWFGAPEHDADEVREMFELAETACLVLDGERPVGHAARWRIGSFVIADPSADLTEIYRLIVAWLDQVEAVETEALERDEPLQRELRARGWGYVRSSYELEREVSDGWTLPDVALPEGTEFRPFSPAQAPALYELIYDAARWAEIAGHHQRDFAEWHKIFIAERGPDEHPVVAWRGVTPVGIAVLRRFADGTGWIAQLAVARSERGTGLGTAVLVEAYRRLVASGARSLGLAVIATNRQALELYLRIGLGVDREWLTFHPPPRQPAGPD